MTDAASNALLSAFTAFWSPPVSPAGRSFPGGDAMMMTAAAEPLPSLFASPRGDAAAVAAPLYAFGRPQPASVGPAAPVPVWSCLKKRRAPFDAACGASEALLAAIRGAPESRACRKSAGAPAGRKGRNGAAASVARAAAPSRGGAAPAAPKLGKRKAARSA